MVFGPPPNYAFIILLKRKDAEVPSQLQLCNEECMRVRERAYMCAYVTCLRYVYYTDRAGTIQNASLDVDLGVPPKCILANYFCVLSNLTLLLLECFSLE